MNSLDKKILNVYEILIIQNKIKINNLKNNLLNFEIKFKNDYIDNLENEENLNFIQDKLEEFKIQIEENIKKIEEENIEIKEKIETL